MPFFSLLSYGGQVHIYPKIKAYLIPYTYLHIDRIWKYILRWSRIQKSRARLDILLEIKVLKFSIRISLQGLLVSREAFITPKDHEPNFRNKPTCRLIDPFNSEVGKVSKQLAEKKLLQTSSTGKISTTSSICLIPSKIKTNTFSYPLTSATSIPPLPTRF